MSLKLILSFFGWERCACVISFSLLAVAESLWLFATSVFLACLPRTLWDAPSKALLTEELADAKDRELALHLLYFLVNVGAALGVSPHGLSSAE